jgi:hypothetical protein
MYNYDLLPEHMRGGARLWIENGIPPGSFMMAVLCNDLKEAFFRADRINLERMKDNIMFWYWEAPSECWGSPEKIKRWHEHEGLSGWEKFVREEAEKEK